MHNNIQADSREYNQSMAPPTGISFTFFFYSLLLLLPIALSEAYDHEDPLILRSVEVADVHDLLAKYGFPKGVLPGNVKSYNVSDKGVLRVQLQKACTVSSLGIRYHVNIRARLAYGSLTRVNGIRGKTEHGFWLTVVAIKVNETSHTVGFSIGGLFKDFPANELDVAPACDAKVSDLDTM